MTILANLYTLSQFAVLPFDLHVSHGIFQTITNKLIRGLKGVLAYQDDVIPSEARKEAHNWWLKVVLHRLVEKDVPFKSKLDVSELTFLGLKIKENGYEPDPKECWTTNAKVTKHIPLWDI